MKKTLLLEYTKEYNVDKWTIRTSLRKAGFPSRKSLINEYFVKFKNIKENIRSWADKLPFDYCTFHKMSKYE